MRITGVESTDLFAGTVSRPLQLIRVTVEGTAPADAGAAAALRIAGTDVRTPRTFGITGTGPGESRSYEVPVAAGGPAGVSRPVTVICESAGARTERQAMITVAEPGWTMWMVSHFHYDPVWWSTQGQFAEARLVLPDEDGELPDARTAFELVRLHLRKARADPDYKFVLAEIDYLKPYFDVFPGDRAQLRELIRDGRAELVGGTYNEPNTNLTSAELTIRNAVYGMGFQRGVMGAAPESAWMLDVFGHDPGFPGLMAAAGLTSSSWARGPFHQWGPEDNGRMQFPAEFEWISPDGTGLLTGYMANHYGAGWALHTTRDLAAAERAAYEQFRALAPAAATRNVMLPVGADHVIPARWVTDVHRSWNARYVWPRFVTAIPRDFFDAVRAEAGLARPAAPARPAAASGTGAGTGAGTERAGTWITPQTRDMNPVYTGKDVSYIDTKQANAAAGTAVSEGERLATLAWLRGAPYPAGSLDKAWRQLAYGAHHDAITGTESDQVYLDLLAGWREAWQRGDQARRDAAAFLAGAGGWHVTVFNGLARRRDGMATVTVRLEEPGTPWLAVTGPDGAGAPAVAEGVRRHPDGSLAEVTLTFRAAAVPALGYRRYRLRPVPAEPAAGAGAAGSGLTAPWSPLPEPVIGNGAFRVTADPARGGTVTISDERDPGRPGRRVLRGPGNELVLQEEHDKHPRWGEGPWHLSPKGPGTGSAAFPAAVRAQYSPAGERLIASFRLGDLEVTQETIAWHGAQHLEFRTHVSGSIGQDRLLRVRFPADVPGGLPLYQTATAVIGRSFGAPEADTAQDWWTLDNPAFRWFGIGAAATLALPGAPGGSGPRLRALGVAEVITPDFPNGLRTLIRDLVTGLAAAGVTATCSRATGPRYGAIDTDSNLPDFRISIGGPEDNPFTGQVLAAAGPAAAEQLAKLLAAAGTARLWVPAARSRPAASGPAASGPGADLPGADLPGADLRGARDLPVLIVAGDGGAALAAALSSLRDDLADAVITAQPADLAGSGGSGSSGGSGDEAAAGDEAFGGGAVALFNQGTPSGVVSPDGTLWMSLMRACSSWPSGVWIDGERRTAPDGTSFAWQHWSHTFRYALAAAADGWRDAGFSARAEEFCHPLLASVSPAPGTAPAAGAAPGGGMAAGAAPGGGMAAAGGADAPGTSGDIVSVSAPNVTLTALKPRGNPLASGRPGTPDGDGIVTARLHETDGRPAVTELRIAGGIEEAWVTDLLEETVLSPLQVRDGAAVVPIGPFATVTLAAKVRAPGGPGAAGPGAAGPGTGGTGTAGSAPGGPGAAGEGAAEPVQPVYARYWLHGKGAAPAGNMPVAVHLEPARVTLGSAGADPGGRLRLTVACGPEPASGEVRLTLPDGISAQAAAVSGDGDGDGDGEGGRAGGSGGREGAPESLRYRLAANGFASWEVTVRAEPPAAEGRYFITAATCDGRGNTVEDAALVTIGEAGGPDRDLPPEELFTRLVSDARALGEEVLLEVLDEEISLVPGEQGRLRARVSSRLASAMHGEAQLISPYGTWETTAPWARAVTVAPGGEATVSFSVGVPPEAAPGWESWLLVKLMYFGRVRYSPAVRLRARGPRESAGERRE
jgi:alpha-mannosidase